MIIEHAADDRRRVVPTRNHAARPRGHAVVAGEVDAGQVDEVQVVVERRGGAVFTLQQLRQVELIGAGGVKSVMVSWPLLPLRYWKVSAPQKGTHLFFTPTQSPRFP